jgi:hypothetical protein
MQTLTQAMLGLRGCERGARALRAEAEQTDVKGVHDATSALADRY